MYFWRRRRDFCRFYVTKPAKSVNSRDWRGIPGQIDQRLTPSYFKKIWNLVYGVVWHAEDDWANIGALQARVNEL